jgi:hypothetical protein
VMSTVPADATAIDVCGWRPGTPDQRTKKGVTHKEPDDAAHADLRQKQTHRCSPRTESDLLNFSGVPRDCSADFNDSQ